MFAYIFLDNVNNHTIVNNKLWVDRKWSVNFSKQVHMIRISLLKSAYLQF